MFGNRPGASGIVMTAAIGIAIAYLLGDIPFGYLLVKLTTGRDVRASGSGNIGATNVLRTTGRAAGVATLLLDMAKGYLAVWLEGRLTGGNVEWMSGAALAVMIGHSYPAFLRFRGGKAMASFVGAWLCLTPLPLAAVLVVFVVMAAWTRYISLASAPEPSPSSHSGAAIEPARRRSRNRGRRQLGHRAGRGAGAPLPAHSSVGV